MKGLGNWDSGIMGYGEIVGVDLLVKSSWQVS